MKELLKKILNIEDKPKDPHFKHNRESIHRGFFFVLIDIVLILASMSAALWFRYDFAFSKMDPDFLRNMLYYMPINVIVTIIIFWRFNLYSSLWRFASFTELYNITQASLLATLVQTVVMRVMRLRMPRSYPFMYYVALACLVVLSRYSYRMARVHKSERRKIVEGKPVNTMVIGAGNAGDVIVREMLTSKHLNRNIACIIDDNPAKIGTLLHGIHVVGDRSYIPVAVERYEIQEIVIAIPTIEIKDKKEIFNICQDTGCKVKVLPGIYQMVNDEVHVSRLKNVEIEDLLGRDPVESEMETIMNYVQDQVVLVTGGGGSIGSELCRQIAGYHPKQLIVVDIYENNAYDLQMELIRRYPELNLTVLIASVRDQNRIMHIFDKYRPDLIFHAAAHKHVPLMENSPNEAIKNNVMGTFNVAKAADAYHVKKMILISTDKAVRPTNIMGASKRICEMVIQEFAQKSETDYAAVRFGNVLGSNGSVIPLFRKQIAEGGPVTVTHPDIIRFFMTIPEAANLVLQAGAFAQGGEIFILDMGEPVKIYDLAVKMIQLSGNSLDQDIEIVFTGLRPGEKLYEELLIDERHLIETENEKIFVCQQEPVDMVKLKEGMKKISEAAYDETDIMRQLVREIVPEYKDPEEVNSKVDAAEKYKAAYKAS